MGIFSRFRNRAGKNQAAETQPKIENNLSTTKSIFWGGTAAGVNVNEISAMQTAAVYSCVRVISEAVAGLPLGVYCYEEGHMGKSGTTTTGTSAVRKHHLYSLLHNAPNPEMTSFVFRETLMSHLLIYGNAFAQIKVANFVKTNFHPYKRWSLLVKI
jgi:HK97 family phage portal protein